MTARRVIEFVGTDLPDAGYWYWRSDGTPQVHRVTPDARARVSALLADALPAQHGQPGEASVTWRLGGTVPQQLTAGRGRPRRSHVQLQRLITGPLTDPDAEASFVAGLADVLLPPALASELLDASGAGERVEFRVQPAPSAGSVPWELLPVASGVRILDIADVVTIPAPLRRESVPPGEGDQPATWAGRHDRPALRVIDPPGAGRIFPDGKTWVPTSPDAVDVVSPDAFDRLDFSTLLRDEPSRLLYVGHVVQTTPDAKSLALLLGCDPTVYGHAEPIGPAQAAVRPFTAEDLARGTIGYPTLNGRRHGQRVPVAALDSDGAIHELPGEQLWPMPPRVALIACESGGDLGHLEPFGLVSAMLDAGAELVTATRWTLPSDTAWTLFGASGTPLRDAVLALDGVQAADDPTGALGDWQRDRLASWRTTGRLEDAPLLWASITHHDGRYRRVPRPQPANRTATG